MPVSLLTNTNLLSDSDDLADRLRHDAEVLNVLVKVKADLKNLPKDATDAQARQALMNLTDPLLKLSKCPDYVVNRGHYFGTSRFTQEPGLSDADKNALIAFIKTF